MTSRQKEQVIAAQPFLSDAWIDTVRSIQDSHETPEVAIPSLRINLIVSDSPLSSGPLAAHIDTSSGRVAIGLGHLDVVDVTVRLSYSLAKSILVEGDGQAALAAYFTRRLKIDGDMTKLFAFQAIPQSADQNAIMEEIRLATA